MSKKGGGNGKVWDVYSSKPATNVHKEEKEMLSLAVHSSKPGDEPRREETKIGFIPVNRQ